MVVAAQFFKDRDKGLAAVELPDMAEVDMDLARREAGEHVLRLLGIAGIEVAILQRRNGIDIFYCLKALGEGLNIRHGGSL